MKEFDHDEMNSWARISKINIFIKIFISERIQPRWDESFADKNFYENIYFNNSSQAIHLILVACFHWWKFIWNIYFLVFWAKWFIPSWLNSFTDKIFMKIFVLEIRVEWFIPSWLNSFTDKNFYENIYFRNSSQAIHLIMVKLFHW